MKRLIPRPMSIPMEEIVLCDYCAGPIKPEDRLKCVRPIEWPNLGHIGFLIGHIDFHEECHTEWRTKVRELLFLQPDP